MIFRHFNERNKSQKHQNGSARSKFVTGRAAIVKKYSLTPLCQGFLQKKTAHPYDTHCIKTGVQLWETTAIMIQMHPTGLRGAL